MMCPFNKLLTSCGDNAACLPIHCTTLRQAARCLHSGFKCQKVISWQTVTSLQISVPTEQDPELQKTEMWLSFRRSLDRSPLQRVSAPLQVVSYPACEQLTKNRT